MKNVNDYMQTIDDNSGLKADERKKLMLITSVAKEIEEIEESRDYNKLFCSHAIDTILGLSNVAFSLNEKDEMCQRISNACAKENDVYNSIIKDIYSVTTAQ